MAYRRLLLPLTGTAAGEAALATAPDAWRASGMPMSIACMSGWMRGTWRRWPARACPAP